jgi:hypothetical protein
LKEEVGKKEGEQEEVVLKVVLEEKMVGPQQGQHPEEKTTEFEEVGEEVESEEMDVKSGEVGEEAETEEDEIEPVEVDVQEEHEKMEEGAASKEGGTEHHPLKVGIPPRWEKEKTYQVGWCLR